MQLQSKFPSLQEKWEQGYFPFTRNGAHRKGAGILIISKKLPQNNMVGCGPVSIIDEPKSCPPKKRAAATKATRTMAEWFCRGLSVPCSSGRRGHVSIQTDPLPIRGTSFGKTSQGTFVRICPALVACPPR